MTKLIVSAGSDKGVVRANNEDCFAVAGMVERDGAIDLQISTAALFFKRHGLFCAVADGMGGHEGGEFASHFVLERLARETFQIPPATKSEDLQSFFQNAIANIHLALNRQGELNPDLTDMGSTLVGIFLLSNYRITFHAGDSRLYRFREGYLTPITRDHSLEALAVNQENAPPKNGVIINSLGGGPGLDCRPEIESDLSFELGDMLMLCSDGLTDAVDKATIRDLLRQEISLREKVTSLIATAKQRGAPDNVTVILIELREENRNGG